MSNEWIKDHTLETAQSLFSCWWAMIEAERELTEQPRLEDDTVVLKYSGCGASCQVYAKNIRDIIASFPKREVI